MHKLGLIAVAGLLAGCAADTGQVARSGGSTKYPDVQAAAPGAAQCMATSTAENAAAAQATSGARRGAGLGAVTPNATLAKAAAAHACDMARRGLMAHHGSSSSGPAQRVKSLGYAPRLTAENIAAGPFSLNRVLNEWNTSSGHLENIYIPQVSEVGIGRAIGSDGKTVFWAAVYSTPKGR